MKYAYLAWSILRLAIHRLALGVTGKAARIPEASFKRSDCRKATAVPSTSSQTSTFMYA
jgi:hypothetical protein